MTPRPSSSPAPAAATGPASGAGDTEPPEQKRTLAVLVIAQVFSGAGLAAGITVGALLAQDMLGATSLAGLPSALFTIGSAAAAVSVGRISHRAGRRAGLALGYLTGAVGSLGVVLAAVWTTSRCCLRPCSSTAQAQPPTCRPATPERTWPHLPAEAGPSARCSSPQLWAQSSAPTFPVTVMGDLAATVGIPALAAQASSASQLATRASMRCASRKATTGDHAVRGAGRRLRGRSAVRPQSRW